MEWSRILLLATLCALLLTAGWTDLRSRIISNRLNGTIALLAPLWWLALGYAPWPDMALQLGLALALFIAFAALFALGAMGGGDVKLIAALALWLPPAAVLPMLMLMAIAGGVLTLVMLVVHRVRHRPGQPEIPYGLAIVGATLWIMTNGILTSIPQ
ncbi:MAG TPA: prepilin peptidase [Sphingomonas sp.]|jgi:prepilin peptidase CpaA|uniref:A24 family peptidase n=1 Tax=Sphingomonas sp. TaxID=28214 RepID=UPI002ED9EF2D